MMNIKVLAGIAVSATLFACNNQSPEATSQAEAVPEPAAQQVTAESAADQLNRVVESYFDESLELNPIFATFIGEHQYNDQFGDPISAEARQKQVALEERYLQQLKAIDASQLTGQELLSYEIFKRDRELAIKGSEFPGYLIPINQMAGVHNFFAQLGSGQSAQPFATVLDYENFISRSYGFIAWMDSAVESMHEGIEKGVVQPRPIMEKVVPQLVAQIVEEPEQSVFWGPVANMPESIAEEDRERLTQAYRELIMQGLVPSYKQMHDFIVEDYLPRTRSTVGWSELPNGKNWYQYQIETQTTLDISAEEIHQLGVAEVNRILDEMRNVMKQVEFDGDLHEFFEHLKTDDQFYFDSEQEVVDAYTATKDQINELTPKLFEIFPKADYEVRPVEAFRAASAAGASYQPPSPDGSRPGIFYINTHNLKAQPRFLQETLSIHEASPGHHFQTTIQQEVKSLPRFRRFGGYTVYSEGWALYAESLGKELGLFTDPYMWYGRLADEQLRAMRLVVDTGLHAMGWTRERAIEFMKNNSSMAESDIVAEVERYIVLPGQALSYKLGEKTIRSLRNYAEEQLGDDFDIKKFHTQILIDGGLPMPILEAKIKRWVASQRSS